MISYEQATARAWVEVDEDALLSNYHEAKSLCAPATAFVAVLKANAYGAGISRTAQVLFDAGVRHFAVACATEALQVRKVLPDVFLLVMGMTTAAYADAMIAMDVRQTVGTAGEAQLISDAAARLQKLANVHFKLDTGLHRLGFDDANIAELCKLPGIGAEGLYTHLALRSDAQSKEQFALFNKMAETLALQGVQFAMYHVVDSIGLTRYKEWQLDAVRVGAFLYGNVPPKYVGFKRGKQVMTLKCRVARVAKVKKGEGVGYDDQPLTRDTMVATLTIGYVDGYPRALSHKGYVSIHGQRAQVLGLVCMDQMMVDVTGIKNVQPGDVATLLGGDIPLMEYAAWAQLNRNECLALIGRRVPRVYLKDGQCVHISDEMENLP